MFFALALQPVLRELDGRLKWQAWYHDDGTLCGTAAQLSQAMEVLSTKSKAIGLDVNFRKCHHVGTRGISLCPQPSGDSCDTLGERYSASRSSDWKPNILGDISIRGC